MTLSYEMLALREGSDEGGATSAADDSWAAASDAMLQAWNMPGGDAGFSVNDAVPLQEILPGAAGGFTLENFVPASERKVYYTAVWCLIVGYSDGFADVP